MEKSNKQKVKDIKNILNYIDNIRNQLISQDINGAVFESQVAAFRETLLKQLDEIEFYEALEKELSCNDN